ncbi:MAG: winged helix DNA-binding domain-containing protein [Tannerellaceae bacterium]|jgi:hypothetical protein|nr:winged helix DNA-binding domain-containing protein [Tannerellaceae bacterium]
MDVIRAIRMSSQQLAGAAFENPVDVVSWMGAVQAQDYNMSKWAVGVRLRSGSTVEAVEKAMERGEIVRTHVMRPTWHLAPAEDIRWMLSLSERHIKACSRSRDKALGITEGLYTRVNGLLEKILEGNRHLTRKEISSELNLAGVVADTSRMNHFMVRAEAEAIVCSGVDKDGKPTYALLEERIAPVRALHREEALARLAEKYFMSHSPASLYDFAWWSGLSVTEARQATGLIDHMLLTVRYGDSALLVHQSCREASADDVTTHLLPSYDEYVISYKDRSSVLDVAHYPKAFSAQGVFHPLILHEGAVIGRWSKTIRKNRIVTEPSFFDKSRTVSEESLAVATDKYRLFSQNNHVHLP